MDFIPATQQVQFVPSYGLHLILVRNNWGSVYLTSSYVEFCLLLECKFLIIISSNINLKIILFIWCFRFYYMGKAIRLEKIYYRNEQQREERRLTKVIFINQCRVIIKSISSTNAYIYWRNFIFLVYSHHMCNDIGFMDPGCYTGRLAMASVTDVRIPPTCTSSASSNSACSYRGEVSYKNI